MGTNDREWKKLNKFLVVRFGLADRVGSALRIIRRVIIFSYAFAKRSLLMLRPCYMLSFTINKSSVKVGQMEIRTSHCYSVSREILKTAEDAVW